jgi:hypothetical protein
MGLSPQQQRVVADLMRLRQLVHKAVSKMDQRWGPCLLLLVLAYWSGGICATEFLPLKTSIHFVILVKPTKPNT